RTPQRLGNRNHRFILPDHPAPQLLFHLEKFFGLLLFHSLQRNTGNFRDDMHHVVAGDEHFSFFPLLPPLRQDCVEFFLGLFFLVSQPRCFLEILRLDRSFLFPANDFDLFFDFFHVGRSRHRVDAGGCAGLVHHVNRFVRQKSSGDVALGKFHRRFERFIGQLRLVMRFVFRPQSFQNLDRLVNRRRIHFHGLESSLQGRVFLDVLAIFVQGGGAHTL